MSILKFEKRSVARVDGGFVSLSSDEPHVLLCVFEGSITYPYIVQFCPVYSVYLSRNGRLAQ